MLSLYLTRHAKSDWADPRLDDHERPLNARGLRDAPEMAGRLKARGEKLDRILSSTALRALTTARTFADVLGLDAGGLAQDPTIYLATVQHLLRVVNNLPSDARSVMLFGHNPGFSEFAYYLTGDGVGDMPTCATVRIDLPVGTWAEVSGGTGTTVWFDFPKAV
jgi:phosphohistidine phosphatase